jgi:hypothetical protein
MNDEFDSLSLFAMAEFSELRAQALDLFDRCLAENNPAPIIAFIERQVSDNPPHLNLLRDFADGLQQRDLALSSSHFDVRLNVIKTFADDYGIDITQFAPANALAQYHLLRPPEVIAYVRKSPQAPAAEDLLLLGKLLEVSVKAAARLNAEIELTRNLETMVLDWLAALNATVGRRYWSEDQPDTSIQ